MQLNLNPALLATVFHCLLLALLQGGSCQQQQDRPSDSPQRAATTATTTATATPVESKENDREDATVKHTSNNSGDRMAKGMWGGNHVRLDVSDAEARIEFDCAHGTLGRIEPDANGNFDVTGTYVAERGGPVRADETPAGRPARYHGKVNDKTLTLTVALTDTGDEVGTFTLTHGKGTRLTKCL